MDIKEMVEDVLVDDPVKDIVNPKESRLKVISDDADVNTDYTYAHNYS